MDGLTVSAVVQELNATMHEGRVDKIAQPEADELILSLRGHGVNRKLLLTTNANAPRLHYTTQNKTSPLQAPMFTMVLRKHIGGGRFIKAVQPDFERIVELHFESRDEMGDRSVKRLVIEIMGKHSNIMLLDEGDTILEAIKHISHSTSSVREVLPGRKYIRPPGGGKINPMEADALSFTALFTRDDKQTLKIQSSIYQSYHGISPVLASEICERAGIAADTFTAGLGEEGRQKLYHSFFEVLNQHFTYRIYTDEHGKAVDFSVIPLSLYKNYQEQIYATPSEVLEAFYASRDESYRLGQKTADLRKLISNHMERCRKKQFLYEKTLKEIENRDYLKLCGELLTAYIYGIEKGAEVFNAPNFYKENETLAIPLDSGLTGAENAQAYFKKYNKQKRAYTALQEQIRQNNEELVYLESVAASLQTTSDESDIAEIRAELAGQGFVKTKYIKQAHRMQKKSKPLHYISSGGFDMYVGKNNTQNDELTLRFAQGGDIWLHTKDIAGSHVIIRTHNETPPDSTLREGANLAAYYSKARGSGQVPVDYALKKHVRKPNGAKPGYVVYDHHKTLYITPTELGNEYAGNTAPPAKK
jgi:predicted ribosome quality control (RQC) complex YloA/Tae2 family protein